MRRVSRGEYNWIPFLARKGKFIETSSKQFKLGVTFD